MQATWSRVCGWHSVNGSNFLRSRSPSRWKQKSLEKCFCAAGGKWFWFCRTTAPVVFHQLSAATFWHPHLRSCLYPSDLSSGRSTRPTILSMSTAVAVCCLPFHNCRKPAADAKAKATTSASAANSDWDTDSVRLWNKIRDWGVDWT